MLLGVWHMIDLHNHLLPGIDDGATDLDEAVALAQMAVDDGISHILCTPHIQPGRFDNDLTSIARALQGLRHELTLRSIPLHVQAAAEVHFGLEVMDGIVREQLPFLGEWEGKPVLLLELPHGLVPHGADRLTRWLLQNGVMPMLAHPERNRGFIATPRRLQTFIDQGCLLQVTAASFEGRFGESAREYAESLLMEGRVTILATDAHNITHRPPVLSCGLARASALIGEAEARRLVTERPWQIAESRFVDG